MADNFLSLNLMLQEELVQLDIVCKEAQGAAQLTASAKTRLWIAISDAIEATAITQSDLETTRVENARRLLRMGTAKAAAALGDELTQQVLVEVDQCLLRALNQLYPYLVTVDYLMQHSGLERSPERPAVKELQEHWSAARLDDGVQSGTRASRAALLSCAYGLPDLVAQLSRQALPDSLIGVEDFKEHFKQAAQTLLNQFFQSHAVEREQAVAQLIGYWFEDVKYTLTRAFYAYFVSQTSEQMSL